MAELLRVGVVGAGIGAGYIAGFQRQPHVEVVALCASTRARLDPLAARYGVPHTYTDYAAMLADEPLDIVVIATPNDLHYPMTLAALDAGKHVLCDKPLALTAAQAQTMFERAEQSGCKHFVPFIWHFLPAATYMREIIASGFLGQTYHVDLRYYVNDMQVARTWRYDRARAGSGALSNTGSHAIHLLQWWLGDFRRVCSSLTTAVKQRPAIGGGTSENDVDDHCAFLGELTDGTPVSFVTSSVALVPRLRLEINIFGSEGSLRFEDDWGAEDAPTGRILAMRRNDYAPSLVPIPARIAGEFLDMPDYYTPLRTCFTLMAAEFVQAIREDRPASPNFGDGLRVQRVIDAVVQSATEERWVVV